MMRFSSLLPGLLLLTTSISGVGPAAAAPLYDLSATINVGPLTSFDISFVDPVTGYYYFADRSSASVDIINSTTFALVGKATGFAGFTGSNSTSGPDGVLVVNNGTTATLYAGDGNSTLRSFDVTNPSAPVAGGTVNTGGGALRLDEMAYSPSGGGYLLAANNANTPAYANLISTHPDPLAPSLVTSPILVPGQTAPDGGLEQSVWDPNTSTWFVSVPSFNGTDAGGVQEYSLMGSPLRTYNFSAMGIGACGSSGLGVGANGNLMVGCSGGGPVVLNPTGTGSIVAQLPQSSGADELWYDPTSNRFFVTGVDAEGHRVIDVFDGTTYALLQEIDLTDMGFGTGSAHSVAVDPLTGEIFVPIPGSASNTACVGGCVAAFDLVPEPPSLPLLLAGLFIVLGLHLRSRKRAAAVG